MAILDQFQISGLQEYTGSFLDSVYYGNTLTNNPEAYIIDLSSSVVTESIDQFQRTRIWSKADESTTETFRKRNILYSERAKYQEDIAYGGSRTSNGFMSIGTQGEHFFDSFLPSPLNIGKANGIKYTILPGISGTLESSTNYNLPAASPTDIPILFGNSVPAGLGAVADAIDTSWLANPFPFQAKYKNIPRTFNNGFSLSEKLNAEVDLSTGATISPVSQSDTVGTVYYVSDQTTTGITNAIYEGEYIDGFTVAPFTEMTYPISTVSLTASFNGSHATDFRSAGSAYAAQQILVGDDGIVIRREEGTDGWFVVQEAQTFNYYDAASSRGLNSLFQTRFGAWVIVGEGGRIHIGDTSDFTNGINDGVAAAGSSYAGTFYGVAHDMTFIAPNNGSSRFVAVGSGGEVQYSADYTGTGTWTRAASSPYGAETFRAVDYSPKYDWFVAVGDNGTIYHSATSNPTIAWNDRSQPGGFVDNLYTVCCHYSTVTLYGLIVAAGENGKILISSDGGVNWTPSTAAGGYTGTFRGSARSTTSETGGYEYIFYLVGDGGMIQAYAPSVGWEIVTESPNNSSLQYNTITSAAVWEDPDKNWPTTGDYIVAGAPYELTKNIIGRVVDIESTGYTWLSGSDFNGFVNTGDTISKGGSGTAPSSKYVRSTNADSLKTFFGFGTGAPVTIPGDFIPNELTFLPNISVRFADTKFIVDDNQFEFARFIGPRPNGFRYGIENVVPTQTKCVFRRDKFGQPRDMLEQRPSGKFYLTDGETGAHTTTQAAVLVTFVSGTTTYDRAKTYLTASAEVSFNKKDSGIYDFEYKSGQPFFDDQIGLTE